MRIFSLLVVAMVLVPVGDAPAAKTSASLILFDQWVGPGEAVRLRARLISRVGFIIQSAVSGERVEFQVDGQVIEPVLTGGDGLAMAPYHLSKEGAYTIKARLIGNPRYEAQEVEALLLYGRLGRNVVVVDVDATKTRSESPRFPFLPSPPRERMPKVNQVLDELSKQYQLVYYHNGREAELPEMRRWLKEQKFPRTLFFVWHLSERVETRTEQMIEHLNELKSSARLFLGITRSPADVRAFLSVGMKGLLFLEDEDTAIPERARMITDWDTLSSLMKGS